jgi:hypothetical protein
MTTAAQDKLSQIVRFINTGLTGFVVFFLIAYYNGNDKRSEKLDDVLIRMAVAEQWQKFQSEHITQNEIDIREVKATLERLRLQYNIQKQ